MLYFRLHVADLHDEEQHRARPRRHQAGPGGAGTEDLAGHRLQGKPGLSFYAHPCHGCMEDGAGVLAEQR